FLSLLRYSSSSPSFFLVLRRPPAPTLFPYTTLFRSARPQDVPWLNLCSSHRRSSRPRSAAVSACTPPRDAATWSSSVDTGTNQPPRRESRVINSTKRGSSTPSVQNPLPKWVYITQAPPSSSSFSWASS